MVKVSRVKRVQIQAMSFRRYLFYDGFTGRLIAGSPLPGFVKPNSAVGKAFGNRLANAGH